MKSKRIVVTVGKVEVIGAVVGMICRKVKVIGEILSMRGYR